jgi:hypothetical protein
MPKQWMGGWVKVFLLGVMAGWMVSSWTQKSRRMAFVDTERIIVAVQQSIKDPSLPKEQIQAMIDQKKSSFLAHVKDFAHRNDATVIASHKVLAGAEDITDALIQALELSEKKESLSPQEGGS